MSNPRPGERLHALDALRAMAMLLGVVLHAAIPFMQTGVGLWATQDRFRHLGFDLLVYTIHAFRMPLFFLLAGFFAQLLYRRVGLMPFVRHRLARVGLPFVAALVVIIPLVLVVWAYGWAMRPEGIERAAGAPGPLGGGGGAGRWREGFHTAHLWFLWYLLLLYAGTAALLAIGRVAGRGRQVPTRPFRWLLGSPFKPVILAALTLPAVYAMSGWNADSSYSFVPPLHLLAYYGLFYGFGWWLWSERDLLERGTDRWGVYLVAGFGAVLPGLTLVLMPTFRGVTGEQRVVLDLVGRSGYALLTWLLVLGFMGLFLRRAERPNAVVRYLADSAYWVYLVHLPLVVLLNIVVSQWPAPAVVKFGGVLVVAVGLLLLSYQIGVRRTVVGRVLNGPRAAEGDRRVTSPGLGEQREVRVAS